MFAKDWLAFLQADEPRCIQIGEIDSIIRDHLVARTTVVHIERSYVLKILTKHRLRLEELWLIEATIRHGIALEDKSKHITFIHEHPAGTDQHFQATIKATANNGEIYVCTFHRLRPGERRRRLRQAKIIRGL